jgi:hypothetical protein
LSVPPSGPTFYVDESIYSRVLIASLVAGGATIERVGIAVPFGSDDETWLEVVGKGGWIALTRDKRIRYRTLEKQALVLHGVGAFTFNGGNATARTTADRVLNLFPKMTEIALSEPKPFLYTFGVHGPLARARL